MGSGRKGGGAGAYNYYGTLAGVICLGPVERLRALIVDGKAVYEGSLAASGDYTELGPLIDSQWLADSSAYLRIYWGTSTQSADAALVDHPPYRGVCYLVGRRVLFGRERTTAPNIEVVVERRPVVDASLVDPADNVVDDGQVNPVAVLAEVLSSPHFAGVPLARFAAADWLAAAEWCNDSVARRALTFCSPLLVDASDLRVAVTQLLAAFDGALYFDSLGRLGVKLLEPGVDPGGTPLLDAITWAEAGRPKQEGMGWDQVPTEVGFRFADRDLSFKETIESRHNGIALRVLAQQRPQTITRPAITRRSQAAEWATELVRRSLRPAGSISLRVRRGFGSALTPGQKVRVDIDPEPGGAGLAQLCVVEETRAAADGPVTLTVRPDTLVAAVPYSPVYGPPSEVEVPVPSIEHALLIPLPPQGWPGPLSIGILATRPAEDVVGCRVFFGWDSDADADLSDETFAELGRQTGFAARAELVTAVDEDDSTLRLQLLDGASGADAYLAGLTAGAEIPADLDELLIVLANVDLDGQVIVGSDGQPELEFASVVSRSAVTADTHDYEVLRARRSLPARGWATTCVAWLIPRASLVPWTHPALPNLLSNAGVGHVRLAAYRADAEDEATLPEWTFLLPSAYYDAPVIHWTDPATQTVATDGSGDVAVDVEVVDAVGDLVSLRIESRKDDGTGAVIHLDEVFPVTGSRGFAATLNFGVGTWILTVVGRDLTGAAAVSQRTITRPSGGGDIPPPQLSPEDGTEFYPALSISITGASPATELHWAAVGLGQPAPTGPGSWTAGGYAVEAGLSVSYPFMSSRRIWARASDGATHSAWVSADYRRR